MNLITLILSCTAITLAILITVSTCNHNHSTTNNIGGAPPADNLQNSAPLTHNGGGPTGDTSCTGSPICPENTYEVTTCPDMIPCTNITLCDTTITCAANPVSP